MTVANQQTCVTCMSSLTGHILGSHLFLIQGNTESRPRPKVRELALANTAKTNIMYTQAVMPSPVMPLCISAFDVSANQLY